MSRRLAIQEVLCRRCAQPTAEAVAEVRRGDMPCGPCRAADMGTVFLVAPDKVIPSLVMVGLWQQDQVVSVPEVGPTGRQAIHRCLQDWAAVLAELLSQVGHFTQHLMETSPEEEVAEAVMGGEPLAGAHLHAHPGDSRTLVLEGLSPEVARRLAQDTFARPPWSRSSPTP